jgi:hypothetical protein
MLEFAAASSLYDDAPIHATSGHQLLDDWSGGDERALDEALEKLAEFDRRRCFHPLAKRKCNENKSGSRTENAEK